MQVPAVTCNTTDQQKMISNLRRKSSSLKLDKPPYDGHNWQSFGQKRFRGCRVRQSYKCTTPNCPAKKHVEHSRGGHVTAISYSRQHNHQPLQPVTSEVISRIQESHQVHGEYSSKLEGEIVSHLLAEMEPEAEYLSSSKEVDEENDDPRRLYDPAMFRSMMEPRFIEQKTSRVDLSDDGYRWLKYAETHIKGNPNPRYYYRCATLFCSVVKHVQRSSTNPTDILTTYEGKHNHSKPPALLNTGAASL